MHWTLQNIVWIAAIALEFVITASVLYRRLWHTYPAFVIYLVGEFLRSISLLAIGNGPTHYAAYFYTYWITECILALQGFVVMREVFSRTLPEQFGLHTWGARLFWWSLAILLAIAVLAGVDANGSDPSRLIAAIIFLKRAESLVRLGLIAALFVFVFVVGIPWTDPVIGIAAGFGIYGAGELVAYAIRSSWGRRARGAFSWTIMGIALCQELLWFAYFFPWRSFSTTVDGDDSQGARLELDKLHDAIEVILER